MFYLIYIIYFFKSLTLGERVFTLVWAWNTRNERSSDWLTHVESAMENARTTAENNGFGM